MNIQKFYTIILLFVIISCNSSDYEYIAPEFEQVLDRNVTVLNDEFLYKEITNITIVDSLLIAAFQTSSTAGYLHIFNKYTGEYLKSFGGVGRGPGELTLPILIFSLDPASKKFYVKSWNDNSKIVAFDVSMAMEREFVPFEEIQINAPFNSKGNIHIAHDIFLSSLSSMSYRYALINSALDTIATYYTYPVISEEDENNEQTKYLFQLTYSWISIKPDKTKFVSTTQNGLLMEIFDISNDNIELLHLRRYYKPSYKAYTNRVSWVGDPGGILINAVTDNYIYGLISIPGKAKQNHIAVFDWEGLPVKLYELDKEIGWFAIDEDEGFGYVEVTESSGDDEPFIGRFPL